MATDTPEALPPLIAELRASIADLQAKFAQAKAEMRGLADEAATNADKVSSNTSRITGAITLGVAAIAAGSIKMAGDFQQSMTQLVTGAGESQRNIKAVSDGILQMAGQVGSSTTQLAQGMYLVESAGYHGAAGLQVLRAAAEGARVGNADLSTVADAVTSALNAYGLKASDASSVTSELVATVAAGKMHMQDLAGALSAVLPTAASAHVSLSQVGGAIATMTAQGTSAQQAAQDLANTIRSLQNPSQVQIREMEQLGLSSNEVSTQLGKKGLTGTIDEIVTTITRSMGPAGTVLLNSFKQSQSAAQDAAAEISKMPAALQKQAEAFADGTITQTQWRAVLKGLPVDQRELAVQFAATANKARGFNDVLKAGSPEAQTFNAALAKMMGGSTGLNVALQVSGTHMATFRANTQSVASAATGGAHSVEGWKQVQKDFNFQLDQAKGTAQALAIHLGTVLLPIVEKLVHAVMDVVTWFEHHRAAAIALGVVIGGMLSMAVAVFTITHVKKMIDAISESITITKKWGSNISEAIGKVVAWGRAHLTAAAEVEAGATEVETAETGIAATSEEAGAASSMALGPIGIAIMAIATVAMLVVTHWRQVVGWLKDIWHDLRAAAVWVFDEIRSHIKIVVEAVIALFAPWLGIAILLATHWRQVLHVAEEIFGAVVHFFEELPGRILAALGAAGQLLLKWGSDAIHGLLTGIEDAAKLVFDFYVKLPLKILSLIGNGMLVLVRWGGDLLRGLWNGIVAGIDIIGQFERWLWDHIVGAIGDAGKWLFDIGKDIIKGLVNGIKALADLPGKAVHEVAHGVVNVAKKIWSIFSPSQVFHELGTNLVQGLSNGISESKELAAAAMRDVDVVTDLSQHIVEFADECRGTANPAVASLDSQITTLNRSLEQLAHTEQTAATGTSSLVHMFDDLTNYVHSVSTNLNTEMYNVGVAMMQGLIDGMANNQRPVLQTIENIGTSMVNQMRSTLGTHSPSTVTQEVGSNVVEGLIAGMAQNQSRLHGAVSQLMSAFTGTSVSGSANITAAVQAAVAASSVVGPASAPAVAGGNAAVGGPVELVLELNGVQFARGISDDLIEVLAQKKRGRIVLGIG